MVNHYFSDCASAARSSNALPQPQLSQRLRLPAHGRERSAAPMKTRRWPVEPEGILVRAISIHFRSPKPAGGQQKTRQLPAGFF
jgi:hypothetical protein